MIQKLIISLAIYLITSSLIPTVTYAQTEEALRQLELDVLEANLTRKIVSADKAIATNNYNKGMAGLLPFVNFTMRDNMTYATNFNRTVDGREIINNFALNNNVNANINSEILVYNGGRNKNLYERFRLLTETADINERITMEDLVYTTRLLYYQVVRQKQLIQTTTAAVDFTQQRLQLAVNKLDIGTGNKVVVLQTDLEKNQLEAELELQNLLLQNLFDQINALRNAPFNTPIIITDTTYAVSIIDKSMLYNSMIRNNNNYALSQANINLAMNTEKDIRALTKPSITGNLGYTFNRADNGGGFFLINQTNGLAGGVVLTMPIYDGQRIKTQAKNANLQLNQAQMQKELIKTNMEANFEQLYRAFTTSERLAILQQNNVNIARENIFIGLSRFKVGVTDGFELEQILQGFLQANFRLIDALYQIKINELELMRLSGKLLSN